MAAAAATQQRSVRLFGEADVARHASLEDVWVIREGKVYDVTDFVLDHPGGEDLVMRYAGKDMGDIMDDVVEHSHSDSAYELLEEHLIGRLAQTDEEKALVANKEQQACAAGAYSGKDDSIVITEDFKPQDTDLAGDFKKNHFLDLNRPLIMQVWNAKFSKEFYLEQVHAPRHLKEPARLFGPWYLEMFTRTSWYVVPMVWLPISAALFSRALQQFSGLPVPASGFNLPAAAESARANAPLLTQQAYANTLACFAAGVVIWTLLEYVLHRFLFHVDDLLPDRPFFLMLHFLLHGIHHYLPMDRLRLVMPPLLFFVLQAPFTKLAHVLFPPAPANAIISGAFGMYVVYDSMHYALHHTKLPAYLRKMKKYHLEHHYKNYEQGFGVTSRIWDYVFRTEL